MSVQIIERLRGMISANQNLPKPPTPAEKLIALESISDSDIRKRAITLYFLREIISYLLALVLLVAVISASAYAVFGPLPATYKGGFLMFLVGAGLTSMKYVFNR